MGQTFTQGNYISDLVKQEGDRYSSRGVGTIALSASLVLGTVLGKALTGAVAVAAAVAAGGNTGNGTVTLANPAFGKSVVEGSYKLRCIAVAANGGTFELIDPNGDVVAAGIKVGTAEAGDHLKLTVNDGATDFALGDTFTIAVVIDESAVKYRRIDPAAADGSNIAAAILLEDADATEADVPKRLLLKRNAMVSDKALVWPVGITTAQKSDAIAQLEALGITVQKGA